MNTINTDRTSDTQSLKQKAGALKQNLQNTLTAAATALSLIVLPAKAEPEKGPIVVPETLPFTKQVISGQEALNLPLDSSRNVLTNKGPLDTPTVGKTRFEVTTPSAGTLTISFLGTMGTGQNLSKSGSGYSNTNYNVDQQIQWGPAGSAMTTISLLDGPTLLNNDIGGIDRVDGEGYVYFTNGNDFTTDSNSASPRSITVNIDAAGKFYLDNNVIATNATAASALDNLTFSFTPKSPDDNLNSIPDPWEEKYFRGLVSADDDPDGDRLTNRQEYAFGTNPTKANPSPIHYSFETIGGEQYFTMMVPQNPEATTITYSAEVSNDLVHWSPLIAQTLDTTHLKFQALVPVSQAPKQFLRLKVDPKP